MNKHTLICIVACLTLAACKERSHNIKLICIERAEEEICDTMLVPAGDIPMPVEVCVRRCLKYQEVLVKPKHKE